jgi:curved DNA-binding protein CbpA
VHGIDYYELLGVRSTASPEEIRSAYRSLARTMHPDAGGTTGTFHLLQQAYETLHDPDRRAEYDRAAERQVTTVRRQPASRRPRPRRRAFGDDPLYVAPLPRIDPATLPWWDEVGGERVRRRDADAPGHALAPAVAVAVVLLALLLVPALSLSPIAVAVWFVPAALTAFAVHRLGRRYRVSARKHRAFVAEFGEADTFGQVGDDREDAAERSTAELLRRYLTRLPGARVFHGLALPGSVFADIDHAVLCGRRLVLIESKRWLPGHYETSGDGELLRDGRRFLGGGSNLPDSLAAYRRLLPELEIRGAMIIYPSRPGTITADAPGGQDDPPLTPEQFVREFGDWLAAEPATVDERTLRVLVDLVVSVTAGRART